MRGRWLPCWSRFARSNLGRRRGCLLRPGLGGWEGVKLVWGGEGGGGEGVPGWALCGGLLLALVWKIMGGNRDSLQLILLGRRFLASRGFPVRYQSVVNLFWKMLKLHTCGPTQQRHESVIELAKQKHAGD